MWQMQYIESNIHTYVCYFNLVLIDQVWSQACWERRVVTNVSIMQLPKPLNIGSSSLLCLECICMQQRQPSP